MTLTFRASQIETNKIISSGSTGTPTGAKLLIYPHDADDTTVPNQGYINQSAFNTGSIGTDIFLYVSGGISKKDVGNSHAITCFGGDIHISGNLTVDGTSPSGGGGSNFFWSSANGIVETSGSLITSGSGYFKNGISGSLQQISSGIPYLISGPNITIVTNSLGQIEITGSTPAASIATLQQSYNAGLPLIGLNNSSGSITITGSLTPTDVYPSLLSLKSGFGGPYGSNYNAIDVYGWTTTEIQSASLVNIRGNGSNGGGGQVTLRSTGDVNGIIGWVAGSGQLYGSSPNAAIEYHPNASALKIYNDSVTGKVSILNTRLGKPLLLVQNGTTWLGGDKNNSAVSFFPEPYNPFMGVDTYGTVYNSGSLVQSGSVTFKNKVEVTGSLSVSGSGGNNGTFNQYNGLRYYPKIVTSLPYTASLNDYIIAVSASAGPGIQLPASEFGRTFIVKDVSGSAATDLITITAAGGELIDGSPTAIIGIDNGSYSFVYFGSGIGWGTI